GETCTISGTPLKAFSDKIDVRIDNGSGDGQYIGKKMKLTIKALKPQFETRAIELATWKAGVPIDFDFKLSVKPVAVTWECLGNLPEGFTFDTDNGRLYGTTNETGRFVFTVIAKNANKLSAKKALNIIMVITDDTTPAPANDPEEQEPEFVNGIAYYERGELTTDMMAEIANSGEIVAAVLPAVEVEESGMYEFTVSLDMAAPEGGLLVWHSFPDGENDDSDSDNAIFLDDSGETIERVPESYTVTVSAWLEPGVIYEPVIAVRIKD
ncbi:MAG: putative Ig domain-containing protein, partial [Synergistaceae bacterium]|nr:putative Ig domain-containing protein [Synergistaceae bacterium]